MFTFRSCQRKTGGLQRFAVALLVSTASIFANAGDISVSARDVNEALWRGDHMEVKYSAQAKWAANDPRYKVIPINYTSGQIVKRALRDAKRNPGAIAFGTAVAAAVGAAGWVIDELTGQIGKPLDPTTDGSYEVGRYWGGDYRGQHLQFSTLTEAVAYARSADLEHDPGSQWTKTSDFELDRSGSFATISRIYVYTSSGWRGKQAVLGLRHYYCSQLGDPSTCVTPQSQVEPASESELSDIIDAAVGNLSASQLRDLFKNEGYLPELTPELNEALQDWANDIAAEENLDASDAAEEATAKDAPVEVQDVRVVDPVAIDGSDIPLEIPDSIWKYAGDIFEKRKDEINDITGSSYQVPGIDFAPDLPQSRACQSIPLKFMGASVNFPGPAGCSALEKLKEMFAYLLYVTTAWVCLQVLTKPRSI